MLSNASCVQNVGGISGDEKCIWIETIDMHIRKAFQMIVPEIRRKMYASQSKIILIIIRNITKFKSLWRYCNGYEAQHEFESRDYLSEDCSEFNDISWLLTSFKSPHQDRPKSSTLARLIFLNTLQMINRPFESRLLIYVTNVQSFTFCWQTFFEWRWFVHASEHG